MTGARLWQGQPFHADESEYWNEDDPAGAITVVAADMDGAVEAIASMLVINKWYVALDVAELSMAALEDGPVDWESVGFFRVEAGKPVPVG